MRTPDIVLLPEELRKKDLTEYLVVMIDVLRASSTITTALASGASKIIPVFFPEEAKKRVIEFSSCKILLGGERGGVKLPGFDLGNSPLEYDRRSVEHKTVLLTTTNGIRTIELIQGAAEVIIGCFLNIQSIVQYCCSYTGKILLVCAGDRGAVSLEDTVCAGMIRCLYQEQQKDCQKNGTECDDSLIACRMYREFGGDLLNMMKISIWGQHLSALGLEGDLAYCARENIYHHIPVLRGGSIVGIGC